jgi:hypothetical protein
MIDDAKLRVLVNTFHYLALAKIAKVNGPGTKAVQKALNRAVEILDLSPYDWHLVEEELRKLEAKDPRPKLN